MNPKVSKFEIYRQNAKKQGYINKLTDERAFFEMFPDAVDYQMLSGTRRKIASHSKSNIVSADGTLMDIFQKQARVVNTTSKYLRWRLYTPEGDIRASFIRKYSDNECQGKGGMTFELGFDSDVFGLNDVLIFEGLRECPIVIRSEPFPDGGAWKYDAVLLDGDDDGYFPFEYVDAGTRVMQIGSLIGEATVNRGNIHLGKGSAYVEFEVPMTRMGWSTKVTDEAWLAAENYKIKACMTEDGESKKFGKGFFYGKLDADFMDAVNKQKDLWLTYGRNSGRFAGKLLDKLTQRDIQSGPGLYEFLESANVHDWNPESNIVNFIKSIVGPEWHDKVDIEKRVVEVWTGSGGLEAWQTACQALDIHGVVQMSEDHYIKEEAFFKGRKAVGINAKQYRSVFIEPFGKMRVNYLPWLDSDLINPKRYKNYPLSSYEFIIFNYGYGNGLDSNIYIAKDTTVEQHTYGVGTWTPVGPIGAKGRNLAGRFNNTLGHENAYELIHECKLGFVIKDTGSMIWIRPAIK